MVTTLDSFPEKRKSHADNKSKQYRKVVVPLPEAYMYYSITPNTGS